MSFDLEERARELFMGVSTYGDPRGIGMRLAREALDAQAEEIAERCLQCSRAVGTGLYWDGYRMCGSHLASDALALISKPGPERTREQELEDGIRAFVNQRDCTCARSADFACPTCRMRRLLEKKP